MATKEKTTPKRLGRGLSSLIVNSTIPMGDKTYVSADSTHPQKPHAATEAAHELYISTEHISPNPYQPRRQFNEAELTKLAESIAQQGVLQPLIVCSASEANLDGDKPYVLIAGERRLRASAQAGLEKVPCIVRTATPQQMLEWALIENIQRADLNPIEKAQAYRNYMDRFSLTQVELAERLAQPRATVANYLRMLDLCDELQQMLLEDAISFGHAKALAGLAANTAAQLSLARKAVANGLSVRQVEALVQKVRNGGAGTGEQPAVKNQGRTKPPYMVDLEEQLTNQVGTRVRIMPGRAKHSGKIVIEFYNLDDFDRITNNLGAKLEG